MIKSPCLFLSSSLNFIIIIIVVVIIIIIIIIVVIIIIIIIITIIIIIIISNSNWTEWSTIQGVIGRVISNRRSAKREADLKLRARLLPELYDTKSNY